jgi:serine/threonine protein kinase HipA of HipAB toxin-antitoxin module
MPYRALLPQEDCCQALSVPPSRKYESDGGAGMPTQVVTDTMDELRDSVVDGIEVRSRKIRT